MHCKHFCWQKECNSDMFSKSLDAKHDNRNQCINIQPLSIWTLNISCPVVALLLWILRNYFRLNTCSYCLCPHPVLTFLPFHHVTSVVSAFCCRLVCCLIWLPLKWKYCYYTHAEYLWYYLRCVLPSRSHCSSCVNF